MAKAVVARCHGLLPWHSRTFFLIFRCICTALVRAAAPDSYSLLSVFLFSSSSFFEVPIAAELTIWSYKSATKHWTKMKIPLAAQRASQHSCALGVYKRGT